MSIKIAEGFYPKGMMQIYYDLYPASRNQIFYIAEGVEQDQPAHTCSLILLGKLHSFISYFTVGYREISVKIFFDLTLVAP